MAPVTLAQAKLNTQEDYEPAIIDEFRKNSALLDLMVFDRAVNPAGGGATLDYGYRRVKTERKAQFRALNTEYTTEAATTEKVSVTLAPLGGAFEIDRVIAKLGPAASGEVAFQLSQLIKSTTTKFYDEVINGDTAVDANGFDGLDKALTGSTTELTGAGKDWSAFTDANQSMNVLDDLDEFTGLMDGPPTAIFGNRRALVKVRAAARRANMYVKSPVDGLIVGGQQVYHEQVGNITLIDPGAKAGTNDPIIPVDGTGLTDLYAVRMGLDGFHGVTITTGSLIEA
ncbi:MAG: phage capsid protein [Corynebacterium sp.]|uniref:major capsid protein n=1 Tax=Corynebacterium sp. TaxID=1720 RepID=UPI0026DED174|nr:phage capsid protein [Corynebacterium sp.]MDO5670848.1 phage capsid protein [Corynebacterium sp.]